MGGPRLTPDALATAAKVYATTGNYSDAARAINAAVTTTRAALVRARIAKNCNLHAQAVARAERFCRGPPMGHLRACAQTPRPPTSRRPRSLARRLRAAIPARPAPPLPSPAGAAPRARRRGSGRAPRPSQRAAGHLRAPPCRTTSRRRGQRRSRRASVARRRDSHPRSPWPGRVDVPPPSVAAWSSLCPTRSATASGATTCDGVSASGG